MQVRIGVDSFAAAPTAGSGRTHAQAMGQLIDRIVLADEVGLDVFGLGEHHRADFMDAAPALILAAAAARTRNIRLTSAVTVLSAADPVRVFQQFATLDLISGGRAEMVVGRGSFIEAFPLFGYNLDDYEELFEEKLDLLLKLRDNDHITWSGNFRPALTGQGVYPRPVQARLPIHIGVGGTPASFVRAGTLGLPLMVAIIGGETHRFRPLIDLYYEAGRRAGHPREALSVGLHSLGYLAETDAQAQAEYYPGYAAVFTKVGKERGWGPVSPASFAPLVAPRGALMVGSPQTVADKIRRHAEALGGITSCHLQMDQADLPAEKMSDSIRLLGEVKTLLENK